MNRYLPTLFSSNVLDLLDSVDEAFDFKVDYPYNLYELKDGTNVLEFALAGFSKEDISVKVEDNILIVSVNSKNPSEFPENTERVIHRAIAKRNLKTKFNLGPKVNKEKIKCEFEDGILTINIPVDKKHTELTIM